jgi:hypothetical protein
VNITIKTVPNEEIKQRAGFTGADWWFDEHGNIEVRVAELGDWREEFALAIHEATEAGMCRYLSISQDDVDRFDFEYKRTHEIDLNAGDEPFAPYKVPHTFSTAIERILTGVMNVDWKKYDDKLSII